MPHQTPSSSGSATGSGNAREQGEGRKQVQQNDCYKLELPKKLVWILGAILLVVIIGKCGKLHGGHC
jgi:hypothetical protein